MIECVEVKFYTVYGWVMHMYLEDGTQYDLVYDSITDRWFNLFKADII